MSSRQEEKAQRKAEREAMEQAAAAKAARAQRVRIAGAAGAAIAVLVVAVVLIAGSGGGSSSGGDSDPTIAKAVPIPPVKETDLKKAAAKAGCVLLNPADEGRDHVTTIVHYKNSNPPASGPHNPVPADDGIYSPGNEPAKEHWVHTLEHGRIEIQYAPGTPTHERLQLETLGSEKFNGTAGYHVLVFENNTKMPYQVAAVAWTHIVGCKTFNNGVFDAIRAFRKAYTDKGPELIP